MNSNLDLTWPHGPFKSLFSTAVPRLKFIAPIYIKKAQPLYVQYDFCTLKITSDYYYLVPSIVPDPEVFEPPECYYL
jgi:hypothetical protein